MCALCAFGANVKGGFQGQPLQGGTKMKEGGYIEKEESGSKNVKEQLFSSLLNLKESVAELQEGISKEAVEEKNLQEVERMEEDSLDSMGVSYDILKKRLRDDWTG